MEDGVDPDTLLEWLQTGIGEERDLQLLLMSDNIDRCFETCPPRTFLPSLGRIFLDETAPENILEVTARAITYYLDVSNECTRRITQVDGALKAICSKLYGQKIVDRTSKDLAEQCVKLLEHVCSREPLAVYNAGGLEAILDFICRCESIHKDTMYSAMALISKLCGKVEPKDVNLIKYSTELAALLDSDDEKIVESVLRCFSTLVDRFVRKQIDLIGLATSNNLVETLLNFLCDSSVHQVENSLNETFSSATSNQNESASNNLQKNRPSSNKYALVPIIVPLLCNLCKGSTGVTSQLIKSPKLLPAILGIFSTKEDQCISYGIRLCDMIIVLLSEGRQAMCKVSLIRSYLANESTSPFNRTQRQLIDYIRQRDADSLIDLMESEEIDPNFVDDVGQTLLNWASAFGNSDMVIHLCEKGADPNKGSRSSSLHYAASFGRAEIVKILLSYGADPFMRDEEGRSALDRAKERTDGEHQNVVKVLTDATRDNDTAETERDECDEDEPAHVEEGKIIDISESIPAEQSIPTAEKFDSMFTQRLITEIVSALCTNFQAGNNVCLHRSILVLINKCISFLSSTNICSLLQRDYTNEDILADEGNSAEKANDDTYNRFSTCFVDRLMGVILIVLNHDDGESKECILQILKSLLKTKDDSFWLEQLVRLGICDKIEALAYPKDQTSASEGLSSHQEIESVAPSKSAAILSGMLINPPASDDDTVLSGVSAKTTASIKKIDASNDAWRITIGTLYKWKEWRIARSKDSTFIWCDAIALELCDGSNGWLRFFLDGKLNTMYSSGTPEAGGNNSDCRTEFVTKFTKVKESTATATCNIFSAPKASRKIELGNWSVGSSEANILLITNSEGSQQKLTIKEEHPGFLFEAGKNHTITFTAESTLGPEFETGWISANRGVRKITLKSEYKRVKIHELAKEVFENYLKDAKSKPHQPFIELQECGNKIHSLISEIEADRDTEMQATYFDALRESLECLRKQFSNDRLVSTYEIGKSSILPSILLLVKAAMKNESIRKCFKEIYEVSDFVHHVRRVIQVLESNENLPKYLYDTTGGSAYGLQLLTRRLKFRLEKNQSDASNKEYLLDRTNSLIKSEPLVSVGSLRSYLEFMLVKKWYDYPRSEMNFTKQIKSLRKLQLKYESDFDTNGLFWYIGTDGKTTEWINPAAVKVVTASCSDGAKQSYGRPEDILSRDVTPLNCHTSDSANASFTIDMGAWIFPSHYTLRHATGYSQTALRNWFFQASKDCVLWECLVFHKDDKGLDQPGSTKTWPIQLSKGQGPYRYIRIAQNGKNASDATSYLSLSGIEIYGEVIDVVIDELKPPEQLHKQMHQTASPSASAKKQSSTSAAASAIQTAIASAKKQIKRQSNTSSSSSQHLASSSTFYSRPRPPAAYNRVGQRHPKHDRTSPQHSTATDSSMKPPIASKRPASTVNSFSRATANRTNFFETPNTVASPLPTAEGDRAAAASTDVQQESAIEVVNYNVETTNSHNLRAIASSTIENRPARSETQETAQNDDPMDDMLTFSEILREPRLVHCDVDDKAVVLANVSNSHSAEIVLAEPPQEVADNSIRTPTEDSTTKEEPFAVSAKLLKMIEDEILSNIPFEAVATTKDGDCRDSESEILPLRTNSSAWESNLASDSNTEDSLSIQNREGSSASESSVVPSNEIESRDIGNERDSIGIDESSNIFNALLNESPTNEQSFLENDGPKNDFGDPIIPIQNSSQKQTSNENVIVDIPSQQVGTSTTSVDVSAARNEANVRLSSNRKANLLSRLDNYAEAIKSIMSNMIRPGEVRDDDDEELELEKEILEDILLRHELRRRFIEGDGSDGGAGFEEANISSAHSNFHSQLESFASVATSLRRQLSSKLGSSSSASAVSREIPLSSALKSMGFGAAKCEHHVNTSTTRKSHSQKTRTWDDEYCLKRSFESILPAFDPRPGRQNVNQIQEVELTENLLAAAVKRNERVRPKKISLFLVSSSDNNQSDQTTVEGQFAIKLENDHASVFNYIQELVLRMRRQSRTDKEAEIDQAHERANIWDPTYTLQYANSADEYSTIVELDSPKISTVSLNKPVNELFDSVLELIKYLDLFSQINDQFDKLPKEIFQSQKITQKLVNELVDPVVCPTNSIPKWCNELVYNYPCLFSVDTRLIHLRATAFGDERTIIWLQNRRDHIIEQNRSSASVSRQTMAGFRREDHYPEYRIGRIKHERIKVNRSEEKILDNATKVLKFHAQRKAILEIGYYDEEGTGLGPTLEFYSLVTAEFRRKALKMWICEDDEQINGQQIDLGEGVKPPGYYVQRIGGLFPAYLPPDSDECRDVTMLFETFGIFIAKLIQDHRMVDIPLSTQFLKIILSPKMQSINDLDFEGLLTLDDLEHVLPIKARFLKQLEMLVQSKKDIRKSEIYDHVQKEKMIHELTIDFGDHECSFEDLALTFVVNPPSKVFGFDCAELIEGGANIDVTIDNVEDYLDRAKNFYLNIGIKKQIQAFRNGFNLVFPLSTLAAFTPDELQVIISGDQSPQWTNEDLISYTEPKLGYTRESKGFLNFVEVLLEFDAAERKAFLQFATGCASLPPGGLANLHPRLTVVKKTGDGATGDGGDGQYPSVNTCVHYLKLPEYSSTKVLREKLIAATSVKGFHLN